jgi:hypothetical protein
MHEWPPPHRPLRVYTDLKVVEQALTDARFQVVPEAAGADVYWATPRVKGLQAFLEAHPRQVLGQMPNERALLCKVP